MTIEILRGKGGVIHTLLLGLEIAEPMGKVASLMKTLEEQSKGLSECFNEQNAHVGNRLAEFLQTLEEHPRRENSPIPWSRTLDDYEQRG